MISIKLPELLKALPSLFLLDPDAIMGLDSLHQMSAMTQYNPLIIQRQICDFGFDDYTPSRLSGRLPTKELFDFIFKVYGESQDKFTRTRKAKLLNSPDGEIYVYSSFYLEFCYFDYQGKSNPIEVEELTMDNRDVRPQMPLFESDRLTFSSNDSVWNHFKMCALIAKDNETPVVNLITSERNTLEIHASNNHEEYRSEIPLIGGEAMSNIAIGIPVSLIDEVSYWMHVGLHTENHLDIWLDENHVKIGTNTNQVMAKAEEYQPQLFDWEAESGNFHQMKLCDLTELAWAITHNLSMNANNICVNHAPIMDLCVKHGEFSIQENDYRRSPDSVGIGITELKRLHSLILDRSEEEMSLTLEVDAPNNHVVFSGKVFDHDTRKNTRFQYAALGVIPNIQDEVCIYVPGHNNKQYLDPEEEPECLHTGPCQETVEGTTFIERFPLDYLECDIEFQEELWDSLEKQECPTFPLKRKAERLKDQMVELVLDLENLMYNCGDEEINTSSSTRHDIESLQDEISCLKEAIKRETKLFDPKGTKRAIAILNQAISDARWSYFRAKNKQYWNDNPHLWQQTFA